MSRFLFGVAVAGLFLGLALPVFAFVPGPFGGQIFTVRSGNNCIVLDIGPPRGGEYIFVYGASQLFAFFTLRPGAWVIGLSAVPQVCFAGKVPIGAGPTVIMIGTSF